jgi:hypothetical protein
MVRLIELVPKPGQVLDRLPEKPAKIWFFINTGKLPNTEVLEQLQLSILREKGTDQDAILCIKLETQKTFFRLAALCPGASGVCLCFYF